MSRNFYIIKGLWNQCAYAFCIRGHDSEWFREDPVVLYSLSNDNKVCGYEMKTFCSKLHTRLFISRVKRNMDNKVFGSIRIDTFNRKMFLFAAPMKLEEYYNWKTANATLYYSMCIPG